MLYRLHFSAPFGHAKHYVGFAEDCERQGCSQTEHPFCGVIRRFKLHGTVKGANLTYKARQAGISFVIADVWSGDREAEARLKYRNGRTGVKTGQTRLCSVCKGKGAWHEAHRSRSRSRRDAHSGLLVAHRAG